MNEPEETEGGGLGAVIVALLILLVTAVITFGILHVLLGIY
jgi:hypothetical protein